MEYYLKAFRQYADFNTRARRKEYWMFVLFNAIFITIAVTIDLIHRSIPVVSIIYSLAIIIPSFAIKVRRLHDVGKSGVMLLVSLIPFIGGIWLLILYLEDSEPGTNKWGPNPKETEI